MSAVIDASALLAMIGREQGWDRVSETLRDAAISTVNLSEVLAKLTERGMGRETTLDIMAPMIPRGVEFDAAQALDAGFLRVATRHLGLSLGDRACLALARQRDMPVLTADRAWGGLDVGVAIELIR